MENYFKKKCKKGKHKKSNGKIKQKSVWLNRYDFTFAGHCIINKCLETLKRSATSHENNWK